MLLIDVFLNLNEGVTLLVVLFFIYFKIFGLFWELDEFKVPINSVSNVLGRSEYWKIVDQSLQLIVLFVSSKRDNRNSIFQLIQEAVHCIVDDHNIFELNVFKDP